MRGALSDSSSPSDYAATQIQRIVRGFAAKKLSRKLRAARHREKIQLRYQDKEELFRFYFEQVGATIIIQRWFRRWPWRVKTRWRAKYGKLLMKKREELLVRPPPLTHRCAVVINRITRGFLGRRAYKKMQIEAEIQQALQQRHVACTIIQSLFRAQAARREYPMLGLRNKSRIKRERNWSTVCRKREAANAAGTYFPIRRNSISYIKLSLVSVERIAKMSSAAVRIQCLVRKKIARKVFSLRVEERKLKMLIRLQRWFMRMGKAKFLIKVRHECKKVIDFRRYKNQCAARIQKLVRRAHYNIVMKYRLHAKWVSVRRMQRWALRRIAAKRRNWQLRNRRAMDEIHVSGDFMATKTMFFLSAETLWVGIRKVKNLDVPHELQVYFLSLAGHSRMLEAGKFVKAAKGYPNFYEGQSMTSNIVELQFSKVKAITEKKLDYPRFINFLANLAAIKFLKVDPTHIGANMTDTPFVGVFPGLTPNASNSTSRSGSDAAAAAGGKQKKDNNNNKDLGTGDSDQGAEIKKLVDKYTVGRLKGKAALVVRFVLTYLCPNGDASKVFQSLKDKSAWAIANAFLVRAVNRIRHFFIGRIDRLRYIRDKSIKDIQIFKLKQFVGASKFQSVVRGYLARMHVIPIAQQVYCKYLDDELKMNYWFNPRTQRAMWSKPRFLHHLDCGFPVTVPPVNEQFLITCSYCDEASSSAFCFDCDEPYCGPCFGKFHKAGHRRGHKQMPLIPCIECEFQAGVRYCTNCKDCFCDSCYTVLHSKGRNRLHVFKWCHEVCQDCGIKAAQWRRTDEFTGIGVPYCVVCFIDRFEQQPTVGNGVQKIKYMGKIIREYQHEQEILRKKEEKDASALKHLQLAEERRRVEACSTIQRVWRGRRAYKRIKRFLLERKEFLHLREIEMPIRKSKWFRFRELLGFPMHLRSDTTLEKVHKLYPRYLHHILAACIEDDWPLACQLLEEHEQKLKEGEEKGTTMQGSAWSLPNLIHGAAVGFDVRKRELQLRASDVRIGHLRRAIDALRDQLEEARAIEDTPKAVKDKLAADIKAAEKQLIAVNRERALVEKDFQEARQRQHDFLGPRGLQRLVKERRKHGIKLPFTVNMRCGSRVAFTRWEDHGDAITPSGSADAAEHELARPSTAERAEGSKSPGSPKKSRKLMRGVSMKAVRANGWMDNDTKSLEERPPSSKTAFLSRTASNGEAYLDEGNASPSSPHGRPKSAASIIGNELPQGLWKAKLRLNDVIMINGVIFRVVRKEDVFKPTVAILPKTPTAKELKDKAPTENEADNSNDPDINPEDAERLRKQKAREDLTELEALLAARNTDGNGQVVGRAVDPWCIDPPTYPEMNELEFTADHIALDRPWVLPDSQNLEVYKVVPRPFYEVPGRLLSEAVIRSYPIQKAVAIAAITCNKIASKSRQLASQFDEDSETAATMKHRAMIYDIRTNTWLTLSRSIVHMSYDFALRRSMYRAVRLMGRGVHLLGRVAYHNVKKKTKKKELTPFQHWESSKAKVSVSIYIATTVEDDDDLLVGVIQIDLKAPADILREYIRRNFQQQMNDGPLGDSFLFSKEKKGQKPEVFPRAVEPKKYTKDVTVLRMDHKTMETTQCALLVAEPHVAKVLIEVTPDPDPEDEDDLALQQSNNKNKDPKEGKDGNKEGGKDADGAKAGAGGAVSGKSKKAKTKKPKTSSVAPAPNE